MEERALLHYSGQGPRRPHSLLHGIGMAHTAWSAVTPYLCSTQRVIARDISVGSRCMPVNDALRAMDDLAASPAFEATFDNTGAPFSGARNAVPVTLDLLKRWRRRNELPAHTAREPWATTLA